jgi:ribose 5-phosphate isomerase B
MRIAIGADHAGFPLKGHIIEILKADGHTVQDLGTYNTDPVDYPDYAKSVGEAVLQKQADAGILLCGSGAGASIAACKIPGIRAALVHDAFTAKQCREDDDANVMCLGSRVIGPELAVLLTRMFLGANFSGLVRHRRRLAKVAELEKLRAQ